MLRWIVRRCLHSAFLLVAVSVLSFLLGRIAPGSFFDDLKLNPQISRETIAKLELRYGIGQPFVTRYIAWAGSAARGDFGVSLAYQLPVAGILWPRALRTLALTVSAGVLTWLLALPLGILAASRPRGPIDRTASGAAAIFQSVPELILALILLYILIRLGAPRLISTPAPALAVLLAGGFPTVFRHVRASVAEAERAPFVRAARAHGIRGARLWLHYISPAASPPLLSLLGLWIGGLIGGSLLVENVFGWPGLGPLFLDAVSSRDLDIVTAVMLLSASFVIAGNLIADILIGVFDPRVRSLDQ